MVLFKKKSKLLVVVVVVVVVVTLLCPNVIMSPLTMEDYIGTSTSSCLPLPIRGEGIFDSVYLGKRLRIGQNINGGGARVVQIKL